MSDAPILALENVSFGYAGGPALFSGLSFALRRGEHLGLYGPNGSGKTTLLRLLTGLETPHRGRLLFHGVPVSGGRAIAWYPSLNSRNRVPNSDKISPKLTKITA